MFAQNLQSARALGHGRGAGECVFRIHIADNEASRLFLANGRAMTGCRQRISCASRLHATFAVDFARCRIFAGHETRRRLDIIKAKGTGIDCITGPWRVAHQVGQIVAIAIV